MVLSAAVQKKNRCVLLLFAFVMVLCAIPVAARYVPALTGYVVYTAGIVEAAAAAEIETYLSALYASTGIQMAVLTVPSLEGEALEAYSIRVTDAWKIGSTDNDNGALLLIAYAERKVRIEVGYGLEGILTDAKCGLIIRNVIAPEFRAGNYGNGILAGVRNMGGIASGEAALIAPSVVSETESDSGAGVVFGLLFFIVWFMIIPNIAGRRRWWLPWFFVPSLWHTSSGRASHSWHGGSSGSLFGGFGGGGGRFGGGGASGGW